MRLLPRRRPLVSVVIPVYDVERWLPDCLTSLTGQTYRRWEAIVVDDGTPDRSGEIADEWAREEDRIRVVHTANAGLGAARNEGVRHARGDYLAFLDADDMVPATAYAAMVGSLEESGSDFATGMVQRLDGTQLRGLRWLRRQHTPPGRGMRIEDRPTIAGDVFAWNKLFRRSFWESEGLAWPEGIRYEDQPTTTRAFLAGRFDIVPEVVYHWRLREDGTSITQQRATLEDLRDRLDTKRQSLRSVQHHGDDEVTRVYVDGVLAGDMWRYFMLIPDAGDDWWQLLREGVKEFWGERSLIHATLPPVQRLCGWLVEQDRREDAVRLMRHVAEVDGPLPRVEDPATGGLRLDVPPSVLDLESVAPEAVALRPWES